MCVMNWANYPHYCRSPSSFVGCSPESGIGLQQIHGDVHGVWNFLSSKSSGSISEQQRNGDLLWMLAKSCTS